MRTIVLLSLLAACSETSITERTEPEVIPDPADPVPVLQVEPRQITFDPVEAGGRETEIFTVTNIGEGTLDVLDVAFVDPPDAFRFEALDGTSLGPGEAADWSVSYVPEDMSTETESATIRLTTNAPADPTANVDLSGTTLLPAFELTPASHDFGVINVGEQDRVELVLSNVGEAAGEVTTLDFTTTSPEIALEPSDLDALPITLQPGASVPVGVTYAPTDAAGDEATVEVITNAPASSSLISNLQGEGFAVDRDVEIFLTADDAWTGFIDGVEMTAANQSKWTHGDTITRRLPAGKHVIAIQATDVGSVISGFIAVVRVDGTIVNRTGEGKWMMTATSPPSGWQSVGFDDSAWSPAEKCSSASTWGTYWPKPFYDEGAEWVWWTSACRDLRQAWFRLEIEL